jgi:hypothetical protein
MGDDPRHATLVIDTRAARARKATAKEDNMDWTANRRGPGGATATGPALLS